MQQFIYLIYFFLILHLNADCPSYSVDVTNENLCLVALNQTWDFHTAENLCTFYFGGNVARIDNLFVNVLVQSVAQTAFTQQTFYIGVVKSVGTLIQPISSTSDGTGWRWTDGTPIPYQKWDYNQPSNQPPSLLCVQMNSQSGYWRTMSCGTPMPAICTFPKNRTQTTVIPVHSTLPTVGSTLPSLCPDCNPSADNILFLIDIQSYNDGFYKIEDLKATLKAALSSWTHFERFALATYTNKYYQAVYYTQMNSYLSALNYLDQISTYQTNPNITSAIRRAPLTFQLTKTYTGKQKTVLFIQSGTSDDIQQAQPYAQFLRETLGKVIVVVVGGKTDHYKILANNGSSLGWVDTQDSQILIAFLNAQLIKD